MGLKDRLFMFLAVLRGGKQRAAAGGIVCRGLLGRASRCRRHSRRRVFLHGRLGRRYRLGLSLSRSRASRFCGRLCLGRSGLHNRFLRRNRLFTMAGLFGTDGLFRLGGAAIVPAGAGRGFFPATAGGTFRIGLQIFFRLGFLQRFLHGSSRCGLNSGRGLGGFLLRFAAQGYFAPFAFPLGRSGHRGVSFQMELPDSIKAMPRSISALILSSAFLQ